MRDARLENAFRCRVDWRRRSARLGADCAVLQIHTTTAPSLNPACHDVRPKAEPLRRPSLGPGRPAGNRFAAGRRPREPMTNSRHIFVSGRDRPLVQGPLCDLMARTIFPSAAKSPAWTSSPAWEAIKLGTLLQFLPIWVQPWANPSSSNAGNTTLQVGNSASFPPPDAEISIVSYTACSARNFLLAPAPSLLPWLSRT